MPIKICTEFLIKNDIQLWIRKKNLSELSQVKVLLSLKCSIRVEFYVSPIKAKTK